MIKYQLICEKNHEFEGWFQCSAAYDEQVENGLLRCPLCDSDQVKRALMTPNLASPKRRTPTGLPTADHLLTSERARSVPIPSASAPFPATPAGNAGVTGQIPVVQAEQVEAFGAALAELRQFRQKVIKDCRDVGNNFAEEARKIHYGEVESEGIYGQTTLEEREALKDEGIEIFDMPWVPTDH